MSDLVERLRSLAAVDNCQASLEAADEITRLRTEVEKLRAALEQAARHICLVRDDWSTTGVNADDRNEWPEYIRAALEERP